MLTRQFMDVQLTCILYLTKNDIAPYFLPGEISGPSSESGAVQPAGVGTWD